jgi:DNA-binding CsgD family transcriptional regulator
LVLLLCCLFIVKTQHIAAAEFAPVVTNYTKKEYKAANQNWAIGQDEHGLLYFGNNSGLLRFDGVSWELFYIPGKRIVRSVLPDGNGRVYVGSFEEFGYFQTENTGEMTYHSLSQELKSYKMLNDEIWSIVKVDRKIYFQSFTSFFVFDGQRVTGYRMPVTFLLFNKYRNTIFTHIEQRGLCWLDKSKNRFVKTVSEGTPKGPVTAVLPYDNRKTLLVTTTDGLYLLDGTRCTRFADEASNWLMKSNANRAIVTRDSVFIVGTILNGVIAVDKHGKILWKLNTTNFLQNNTVLGMFCDRDNNVWLALDKGIALVHTGGKIIYIASFRPSIGAIYGLNKFGSDLYIGTNQGLYYGTIGDIVEGSKNLDMNLLPRIKGQVWDLQRFGNQLFCSNNEETFCVNGQQPEIISPVRGGCSIKQGIINGQEVLVQATYTQLCIFRKNNQGKWIFSNVVDNFVNPIRYVEIDYQGAIWAAHFHQGLYRIELSQDLKHIRNIRHFQSLGGKTRTGINVFKVANRVVFTNGEQFYTFNDLTKEIIPFKSLNDGLGIFASAYKTMQFKDDYYWFIRDDNAALVKIDADKPRIIDVVQYSSFPIESVDNNQTIVPVSDTQCLFCLENGLALYSLPSAKKEYNKPFHLILKSVLAYNADNTNRRRVALSRPDKLPFSLNSLVFSVAYPNYENLENVRFRYKLEGLDKRWSDIKSQTYQEYVRLPYQNYTFRTQAVTSTGEVLDSIAFDFVVAPPFYLSIWAKIIYFMLTVLVIILFIRKMKAEMLHRRENIEQKHIELRRKEQEKSEQQIMRLEKEKLESEVMLKSKELASSTMSIIKKNDILVNIKEELIRQKEALGTQYPRKYFERITHIIDENLSSEDDWSVFQTNFDRIHENFFRILHTRYPDLTSNDLRLCAYLRLNLTSKDIANLMNISLKGVEAGRYRLRKKLNIGPEKSLTDFMIELRSDHTHDHAGGTPLDVSNIKPPLSDDEALF